MSERGEVAKRMSSGLLVCSRCGKVDEWVVVMARQGDTYNTHFICECGFTAKLDKALELLRADWERRH